MASDTFKIHSHIPATRPRPGEWSLNHSEDGGAPPRLSPIRSQHCATRPARPRGLPAADLWIAGPSEPGAPSTSTL